MELDKKIEDLQRQRIQAETLAIKLQGAIEILMQLKEEEEKDSVKKK